MSLAKYGFGRRSVLTLLVIGAIILFGGLYYWWQEVYSRPENTFNRMLNNSLSTRSVTKYSVSTGGGQDLEQATQITLSNDPKVRAIVKISQMSIENSMVERETITTKNDNFIRLNSIQTSQKNVDGSAFDFTSILNIWGYSPANDQNNSISQIYGQNVAVPFANLGYEDRQMLLEQIHNDGVYEVDYENTSKIKHNGRNMYNYAVSVKPDAFINMMKTLGLKLNIEGFDDVNPDDYKEFPAVKFNFIVDILSGDLVRVDYGNDQVEDYSGYGLRDSRPNPKDAISMFELQTRLQNLQK